jgi:hypothetical protein
VEDAEFVTLQADGAACGGLTGASDHSMIATVNHQMFQCFEYEFLPTVP